jgi:RimJ/RimL family protein N-acetyltransferase
MQADRWVTPVVLEGRLVRLEPLVPAHFEGLCEVALVAPLWTWMPTRPHSRDDLRAWMEAALAAAEAGTELPFTTIDVASSRPIGSTRYLNIVPAHRRLEIGWTWVTTAFQRTGANREAKLLQMEHAFETLGANRVEFKTDSLNERSRAALLGIGATYEGTLRDHMVMPDGRLRHSAYYSVVRAEWPAVRAALAERLDRG